MKTLVTNAPEYIYQYSATELVNEFNDFEHNEFSVTWDSAGGSVLAAWKIADFLHNTEKEITARVTGYAASMGASLLPYFHKVVGLKQSWIMIHAPRGGAEKVKAGVVTDLINAFNKKVNSEAFKGITGKTIEEVMNEVEEERNDYWLTGQQAYDIGLYDELVDLNSDEVANSIEDCSLLTLPENINPTVRDKFADKKTRKTIKKMTVDELRVAHPEVCAELENAAVAQERDRVGAFLTYADVDLKAVLTGVEGTEDMTQKEQNHFLRKLTENAAKADLSDNAEDFNQGETAEAKAEKELISAFDRFSE